MNIIKLACQSVAVLATAFAMSPAASAAPSCNAFTGPLDFNNQIACGTVAKGRFAGSTSSKSVLTDLIKGSQLDVAGVTPTGKLLAIGCAARDKTTTGAVVSPSNVCIPKPGESWGGVLGTLYQ
jgi:hypothetical protein